MRVITGTARGHPLKVPKSASTRPTPARAKEAIFSSLGETIVEARVLDLFAGSGALGIEALSRGASSATFVEGDRQACATLHANLKSTHLEDRGQIMQMDVRQVLTVLARDSLSFDIIFADPPYLKMECRNRPSVGYQRENIAWKEFLLHSEELKSLLKPSGLFLLEYYKQDSGVDSPYFRAQKDFRFGDTVFTLFRHV